MNASVAFPTPSDLQSIADSESYAPESETQSNDSLADPQLKRASAICHKLHSKRYQPVGLDQETVNYLVQSQIKAKAPVRAPW